MFEICKLANLFIIFSCSLLKDKIFNHTILNKTQSSILLWYVKFTETDKTSNQPLDYCKSSYESKLPYECLWIEDID